MSVPVALGVTALESNVPATALYTSESEFIVDAGVAEGVKLPARAKENVAKRDRRTTKNDLANIFLILLLNCPPLDFLEKACFKLWAFILHYSKFISRNNALTLRKSSQ